MRDIAAEAWQYTWAACHYSGADCDRYIRNLIREMPVHHLTVKEIRPHLAVADRELLIQLVSTAVDEANYALDARKVQNG